MSALLHSVVVASAGSAEVTTSDNTLTREPAPRRANLATIAAHGLALQEVAAGSGIGYRKKRGEVTISGDADTIIESLGGAVGPA